jgi:hypothetical protein
VGVQVRELVLGNGEAVGGLKAFGRSGVVGVDLIVIVVVVVVGEAGDTAFTRGR